MSTDNKQCHEYYVNNDYPVDIKSDIHPYLRAESADSMVANPPING